MNAVWNLDRIYKGFDDPAFEGDMEALRRKVAQLNEFVGELDNTEPLAGLKKGIALLPVAIMYITMLPFVLLHLPMSLSWHVSRL